MDDEVITDINVKTLAYIKKCKKMASSRNIIKTKQYLKENNLLAVPFDKGIGICLMKKEKYQEKLDTIISLPQFAKLEVTRKNAKNPFIKEEERIVEELKEMLNSGQISQQLFEEIKPSGSQPARLYGLAKVHKRGTPVRPVLSMPGSAYHRIAQRIAKWLSVVPECGINSSTKSVCDSVKDFEMEEDEEVVSFDVSSLYTNVPLLEAIHYCADLLYNGRAEVPPVDKDTFIALAKLALVNVIMLTHAGVHKQVDGLAMGSAPAPHLANGWLSKYDPAIQDEARLFARYMDDIFRNIKRLLIESKLEEINNLHPNLKFTIEREENGCIPFLDMRIIHADQKLQSTWYCKPTDTGLIMNYHALAPKRYKRSVVSGFVHRLHRACSSRCLFNESMTKAKAVLEANQYPPSFYEPIIRDTLEQLSNSQEEPRQEQGQENAQQKEKKLVLLQYRGKCTEDFARALHKINAPCQLVMTLRKLKTVLPSLKPPVEKMLRSGVVYQITCPRCKSSYVGQTTRHLKTRFAEHRTRKAGPVRKHFEECEETLTDEHVSILSASARGEQHLLTLEALFIRELKPTINTKDEWRSKELTIKL